MRSLIFSPSPTPSSLDIPSSLDSFLDPSAPPLSQPRTYTTSADMPMTGPSNFPGPANLPLSFIEQFASGMPGYSAPFMIDYMRELHSLRERVRILELENTRVVVERDTLREVLNHKGGVIDPALSGTRPTSDTHPSIKFWTNKDYDTWLDTAEAQIVQREVAYLEEENGKPVSREKVKAIRACMRSAWIELARSHRAPQVWGELDATGRKFFHSFVEEAYPLFKCAQGGWKLDKLARMNYPAWKGEHLDKTGALISKEDRKRRREKCKNASEKDESEENSASAKKQRVITKNDIISEIDTISGSDGSSSTTSYSAHSLPSTSGSESQMSRTSTSPPAAEKSFLSSDEGAAQDPVPISMTLSPPPSSEPGPTSGSPSLADTSFPLSDEIAAQDPEPVSMAPPPSSEPGPTSPSPANTGSQPHQPVVFVNPLNSLAQVATQLDINMPTSNRANSNNLSLHTLPVTTHSESDVSSLPVTRQDLPKPSSTHPVASSCNVSKKGAKMRPGPARNGRNLCAHWWLKAFKDMTSGSTVEFKAYYDALSLQQREAYDKEAKDLVSSNTWTTGKEVSNGKLY